MKIFFASESIEPVMHNDQKVGSKLSTKNGFRNKIINLLKDAKNFVFICNDSSFVEHNEISAKFIFDALNDSGLNFTNYTILDNSTKHNAKQILNDADFIYLQGGTIFTQNQFLKEINFKDLLKNSNAVVMGKSAGAMNLQDMVYVYPETDEEVNNPKWVSGVGYSSYMVIPHFNLTTGNEYCFGNFNLLNDYFIPDSNGKTFYALLNGSYIYLENNVYTLYGETYKIENGVVTKICDNNNSIILN